LQPTTNGTAEQKSNEQQKGENEEDENDLENAADVIVRLINTDCLFGDLAIQFHYGTGVQNEHLGWHTDSTNSLLHMATAISGRRALHSHRAKKPLDEEPPEEIAEWQNPGDIYLSSPALFMHSVEYPENPTWDKRIIAIQARFLFTYKDFNLIRSTRFRGGISWKMFVTLITLSLTEAQFKVPTLEQIKKMEIELKELEEQEKKTKEEQKKEKENQNQNKNKSKNKKNKKNKNSETVSTDTTTSMPTDKDNDKDNSEESLGNLYEN